VRAALLLLLVAGCATPEDPGGACAPADLEPLSATPAYAVVASDYSSSAVGLLDASGGVITEAWLDSGSAPPGVVAALSGDVSLPSAPLDRCTLAVLDRFGTDVLTLLDTCSQVPVRTQVDVGAGFSANPHDVLRVDGGLWVSRYDVNASAEPTSIERGNDVAIVEGGRVVARIDLSLGDAGEAFARPNRMAWLEGPGGHRRVVVGLARLSTDFMVAAAGAVAVIDPETRAAELVELEGLAQCGELDALGDRLLVTCTGAPFAGEEARRDTAGVVALALDADGAVVTAAEWRAADHPGEPVPSGPTVPLDAERWVTVAWGDVFDDVPDRVLLLRPGADAEVLFTAPPFTIGEGAYDPAADLLLLPDAGAGTVRRLRADGTELDPVTVTTCHGLPPREIARL